MKLKGKSIQEFIPIRRINHGIIETTDNRYVKILEIEPINFMLRSAEEQSGIISTFASWLKISSIKMQFKSITRRADSDKHIALLIVSEFQSVCFVQAFFCLIGRKATQRSEN